jgi:hypothetical protein
MDFLARWRISERVPIERSLLSTNKSRTHAHAKFPVGTVSASAIRVGRWTLGANGRLVAVYDHEIHRLESMVCEQ